MHFLNMKEMPAVLFYCWDDFFIKSIISSNIYNNNNNSKNNSYSITIITICQRKQETNKPEEN